MNKKRSGSGELILSTSDILALIGDIHKKGGSLKFTAKGFSMSPSIKHNDIVKVSPVKGRNLEKGDVVLFQKDKKSQVTVHRIVKKKNGRFLTRGDNSREDDGWITGDMIFGIITGVERNENIAYWPAGLNRRFIDKIYICFFLGFLNLRRYYRNLYRMKVKREKT